MNRPLRTHFAAATLSLAAVLPLAALAGPCAPRPAVAAPIADEGAEPVSRSPLTGVELPSGAHRITDKAYVADAAVQMRQLAEKLGKSASEVEVIAWQGGGLKASVLRGQVAATIRSAGYKLQEFPAGKQTTGEAVDAVLLSKPESGGVQNILGVFVVNGEATLLTWCRLGAKGLGGGKVLVDGPDPLTQGTVDAFDGLARWFVGGADPKSFRETLVGIWRSGDQAAVRSVLDLLRNEADLREHAPKGEGVQRLFRERLRRDMLAQAAAGDASPAAKALADAYLAAHPPLVAGDPPLTRAARDGYVEMVDAIFAALPDGFRLNADEQKAVGDWLAGEYEKMSAEDRAALAQIPVSVATFRAVWPTLSDAERRALLAQVPEGWKATAEKFKANRGVRAQYAKLAAQAAAVQKRAEKGEARPADYEALAVLQEETARVQRAAGGDENAAEADKLTALATRTRERGRASVAAAASDAPVIRGSRTRSLIEKGTPKTFAEIQAQVAANNRRFTILSNAMTDMHVTRMNAWAAVGNSPYRWEVRRW